MQDWLFGYCLGSDWIVVLMGPLAIGLFLALARFGRGARLFGVVLVVAGMARFQLGIFADSQLDTTPRWGETDVTGVWHRGPHTLRLSGDGTYRLADQRGTWSCDATSIWLGARRLHVIAWDGDLRLVDWCDDPAAWPGRDLGYERL